MGEGYPKLHSALIIFAILFTVASASIEKEPIKVTHKNSGPKYDIDDVERTKLVPQDSSDNLVSPPRNPFMISGDAPSERQQQQQQQQQPDDVTPIGRVSIRRIFLVPMTAPQTDGGMWSQGYGGDRSESDDETREHPRIFAAPNRPFWPFMPPPPSRHHHLLGGDEASRSPTPDSSMDRPGQLERPDGGEREESDRPRMMIDPIQKLMMDMLQHALNPQLSTNLFKDLNKEASGSPSSSSPTSDDGEKKSSSDSEGLEKPLMKPTRNETNEDVVEIDGKKYLRKTVINRHVGENIIFMTKRLILVPLNETTTTTTPDSNNEEPSIATTVAAPANNVATESSVLSQTSSSHEPITTTRPVSELPKVEEGVVTSSTTTKTTEAPSTVASGEGSTSNPETSTTTTAPSSTTSGADNAAEETTKRDESLMEKISDAISRAVERSEERAGSSTNASP